MERKELHRKISELTELISVNNNRLFLHDDKIAQLEIDLLRKNAIELYEQINMLHIANLRLKEEAQLTRADKDSNAIAPELDIMVGEETVAEGDNEVTISEKKEVIPVEIKPVIEPKEEMELPIQGFVVEGVETKPQPQIKLFEVIEEKVEAPKSHPLVEKLSKDKTEKTNVYEKHRLSKIDSIKKSISILKKYEYQNQLFGKDSKAYSEAIEMLDQAAGLEVAISLIENSLAKKFNWSKDDVLIEELKELVMRRHS
jgi:hypothetical protein